VTAIAYDSKNLISLADRPGHDIKARLLLALTALYVERTTHTDDEKRQYAELAQRLMDMVDEGTRESVISVLRDHPTAPIEITGRAAPNGSAHPVRTVVPVPAPRPPSSPRLAPMILPDARATDAAEVTVTAAPAPADQGESFFAATTAGRRELLALIAKTHEGESVPAAPVSTPPDCERLDAAAMQGRIGELIREFERVFDIPGALCERIANDRSGEPLVVAAMAAGIPIAVLQRMLLLVNPAVGYSVARVYDLTNLYYELDRGAAVRLMSLWREKARRDAVAAPPAADPVVAAVEPPPLGLQARFSELSERIQERSVISRFGRESVVRRDLRSR